MGALLRYLSKQTSSSSSSSKDYYYMRCSIRPCKYYLHLACFQLPPQLSSLPLLHKHDHNLLLQSGGKLKPWEWQRCRVCSKHTNGLYYACAKCDDFRVDIKCASMPDTIYHAAHSHHPLNLLSKEDTRIRFSRYFYDVWRQFFIHCDAGCVTFRRDIQAYACGSCDFMVHLKCAGLPESTSSRRWDKKHHLLLTHDATLNRPGDFYCDQCETQMNPKSSIYHCRSCDLSFHPKCFPTTSGHSRNIKLGQKYVIAGAHCHTLTYQLLTTKRHCNTCGKSRHGEFEFYCALCNFFICDYYSCGKKMIRDGNIKAVD